MTEPIKVTFIADDKGVVTTTKEINAEQKKLASEAKKSAQTQAGAERDRRKSIESSMSTFAAFTAVVVASAAAIKKAYEFAEEGAQILRLEKSYSDLAQSVGADADYMLSALNKSAKGTISNSDLILSANRAMMLGVTSDANQMANLLEVAAFRGRAMGLSTQQAFDDIVTGVGRASPMILDNLGIVTAGQDIYGKFAESIGKTEEQLTAAEKKAALLNFVLEDGNKQLKEAGGLANDAAAGYERLAASTKNYTDEMKKDAAPTFAFFSKNLSETMDREIVYGKKLDELTGKQGFHLAVTKESAAASLYADGIIRELTTGIDSATRSYMAWTPTVREAESATAAFVIPTSELVSEFGGLLAVTEESKRELERYREEQFKLVVKGEELNQKIEEATWQYGAQSDEVKELEQDLFMLYQQEEENTRKFEESTNIRILKRAEEILAADGLTVEEERGLLARGLAMGVYTQDFVVQANTVITESQRMADEINKLPTEKTFTYYMQNSGTAGMTAIAGGSGRAIGGPVSANTPYIVGERGPEMFVPSSSGEIVPNNQLTQGGGNADIINAIQATRINEKTLARTIVTALQQAGA